MLDIDYMQVAIQLAQAVKGQTSPNPPVGSVVVQNNEIVGLGAHLKAGGPHAEVHALRMAGERAIGATIYVTLEPCSHTGQTPPCADLIVKSGVKRAVIATLDEHDVVSGRGVKRLQEAGIEVVVGVLEEEAKKVNAMFFHYLKTKRPFITLKTATSLDGKIATVTGESKWITGPEARLDVHKERHQQDAILVGIETVLKDDPHLTTRLPNGGQNPVRIILDSQLRTPIDAHIVTDGQAPTWIFTGNTVSDSKIEQFDEIEQVKVFKQENTERANIKHMLEQLADSNIMTLYVEGGATINDAFIREQFVDRVVTYIAPKMIGGKLAPTSIGGQGFQTMEEVLDLTIESTIILGNDIKITASVARS